MRILRQTSTRLVTRHNQPGERLAAVCCLLLAVGPALLASSVPEISCQRNGALTQCKLIQRIFGKWQLLEQPIVLQGARSEGICGYSRVSGADCVHNKFVVIVQTQIGEIRFISYASSREKAIAKIQRFIKDPNQPSLGIRSVSWSLDNLISNGGWFVFAMVLLIVACSRLDNERTYKCDFDKTKDWVTVIQQKMFTSKVTEFPVSSIKSITLDRIGMNDCIILTLQSGQNVCIAQAFWGKKEREYHRPVGYIMVNKTLEKDMQAIASFLQI
ncbi:hypothetical protein H6F86_16925 [Phormidium sp. FACHB-592]|uniref:Uncharacterized protein n=1 Tax=Stenomitos frigidus AS-A4 TaxID=2933935 RepID=A0ABV0KR53_9CYAN|nr:hypothetical protein [Phormidium sp. FACHB-592]MBD2075550.1 hypothetical protein [Phormidium sp. FACHB-592]